MTTKITYHVAQDEVVDRSLRALETKFPDAHIDELKDQYKEFFSRLPPVPYLHIFNDEFFSFVNQNADVKSVQAWLQNPPFEEHMAPYAKLPSRPYLSGFHALGFQHRNPDTIDLCDFEAFLSQNNDSKDSQKSCDDFKLDFKIQNGLHDKAEKCPRCKGVLGRALVRTTMGADEAMSAVRRCVNCGYQDKKG
jgi:hypothetical protein